MLLYIGKGRPAKIFDLFDLCPVTPLYSTGSLTGKVHQDLFVTVIGINIDNVRAGHEPDAITCIKA